MMLPACDARLSAIVHILLFFEQMFDNLSRMLMMNGVMSRNRIVPQSISTLTMGLRRDNFFVSIFKLAEWAVISYLYSVILFCSFLLMILE